MKVEQDLNSIKIGLLEWIKSVSSLNEVHPSDDKLDRKTWKENKLTFVTVQDLEDKAKPGISPGFKDVPGFDEIGNEVMQHRTKTHMNLILKLVFSSWDTEGAELAASLFAGAAFSNNSLSMMKGYNFSLLSVDGARNEDFKTGDGWERRRVLLLKIAYLKIIMEELEIHDQITVNLDSIPNS